MAAVESLRIDVRPEPGRVVLELAGELDLAAAPRLQSEIELAERDMPAMLVLDLGDLEFIDSAGLRVILAADQRAREQGRVFAVTHGSPQVERLLELTGVDEHLQIVVSPDDVAA